ncbi:MAG: pyrroline-5-carboxylate reductase [Eggerthellaceae bacterium]|nr:pyrroline-5-carboxylate reductase [Eggerthellaceae bacterium]
MEKDIQNTRIAIVGAGHIGQALLTAWIDGSQGAAKDLTAKNFVVVEPGAEKREMLRTRYGVECLEQVADLGACDALLLCVKPQIAPLVLADLAQLDFMGNTLVLSPVAGMACAAIEEALGGNAHVIRFMPNLPLAIARGVQGVCAGSHATEADVALANSLFGALGASYWVDEAQMHAITAVSGSGPGYMAAFVAAMAEAGAEAGLDAQVAEALARDTMESTAAYLRETAKEAGVLCKEVATPGGTTEAGLNAMEAAGFSAAVKAGVAAAAQRSSELGAAK